MKNFRKTKFTRVIVFLSVFAFLSQVTAWAEVVDLREQGKLNLSDVVLSVVMGAAMGRMTAPGKGAWSAFARIYLIPAATSRGVKALGIKGKLGSILSTAISVGLNQGLEMTEAAKAATREAAKEAAKATGQEIAKRTFRQVIKETFFSLGGKSARTVLKAMGQKALQAAVQAGLYEASYAVLKKVNPQLARLVAGIASIVGAHYLGLLLSKATNLLFLGNTVLDLSDKAVGDLVDAKKEGALADLAKEFGVSKEDVKVSEEAAKKFTDSAKEEILGNLAKQLGVSSSGGLKGMLQQSLGRQTKTFWKQLLIAKSAEAIATVAAMKSATLAEEMEILTSGLTSLLKNVIYKGDPAILRAQRGELAEEQADTQRAENCKTGAEVKAKIQEEVNKKEIKLTKEEEDKGKTVEQKRNDIVADRIQALQQKGVIDKQGRVNSERVEENKQVLAGQIGQKDHQLKMAEMSAAAAFFEGMKIGAISLGLSKLSSKTMSPMHGAYFSLLGGSILRSILISGKNVKSLDEKKDPNAMDESTANYLVSRGKGFSFYLDMYAASHTAAMADFMSFGRAAPIHNADEYGTATFDLAWQSPMDTFFIGRYYDYIKEVDNENIGMDAAITSRLTSSIYSQAVSNFKDVVDHTLYSLGASKTSPLNLIYVQKQRGNYRQYFQTFREAQAAVKAAGLKSGTGWTSDLYAPGAMRRLEETLPMYKQLENLSIDDQALATKALIALDQKKDLAQALSAEELGRLQALGGLEVKKGDNGQVEKVAGVSEKRIERLSQGGGLNAEDQAQLAKINEALSVGKEMMYRIAPVSRWMISTGSYSKTQLAGLEGTVEQARQAKEAEGKFITPMQEARYVDTYTDLFGNEQIYSGWDLKLPDITPQVRTAPMTYEMPQTINMQAEVITRSDFDKANFNVDSALPLANLAKEALEKKVKIRIDGYADISNQTGSPEYNMQLARRRAEDVKTFLVKAGVAEDQIEIVSHGSTQAKAELGDVAGRALDRGTRVSLAAAPASVVATQAQPSKVITFEAPTQASLATYNPKAQDSFGSFSRAVGFSKPSQQKRLIAINEREYAKRGWKFDPNKIDKTKPLFYSKE